MSENFEWQQPEPAVIELAQAHGVGTEYWDYYGNQANPSRQTLLAVLTALGVDVSSDEAIARSLEDAHLGFWRQTLPGFTVVRQGHWKHVPVHVPDGSSVRVDVVLETGGTVALEQVDDWESPRWVDGVFTGQASFGLPTDLPLGWHELVAYVGDDAQGVRAPMAVVPDRLELPAALGQHSYGVMTQLYSVRSKDSWGIGDLDDLTEMASFLGDEGADFILINPLHAGEVVPPLTDSPYLPVTRRFVNPIYIRPENIAEVARLSGPQRSLLHWGLDELRPLNTSAAPIDRDVVFKAKREALEVIYDAGRSRSRQRDFERFRAEQGDGLERFALWCALCEKYGPMESWPEHLRDANSAFVANEAHALAGRIDFYAWLQWIVDEQLQRAQAEAKASGMSLGIMHDLAVGINPHGADVWTTPEVFAAGVSVGAPPDMYSPLGQNWSPPPFSPTGLAKAGYAPLRDMVRTVLRHAGALRLDHVMGFFRLWWIPEGHSPKEGAYVYYDYEAMIGIVLLEAQRAGALVIGEDLGTVEPWVRAHLAERGVLGTSVLWFEKMEGDWPLYADRYRVDALSTVNTHDLPPTAGYLADEHVALRSRLGLLDCDKEVALRESRKEREKMLIRLREYGLLGDDPTEREVIEALYAYVLQTPSRLVGVSLVDGVGERRTQNLPGTGEDEYPNWKMPLCDGSGDPVLAEDLPNNARLLSLLAVARAGVIK